MNEFIPLSSNNIQNSWHIAPSDKVSCDSAQAASSVFLFSNFIFERVTSSKYCFPLYFLHMRYQFNVQLFSLFLSNTHSFIVHSIQRFFDCRKYKWQIRYISFGGPFVFVRRSVCFVFANRAIEHFHVTIYGWCTRYALNGFHSQTICFSIQLNVNVHRRMFG